MPNEFFLKTLQEEGSRLGIPKHKNRALVREYLQTRIISSLYNQEESKEMSFIGGTSLRLMRGLDRFSEDLDFDNLGLAFSKVKKMFAEITAQLERDDFVLEYSMKKTNGSAIGDLKFSSILFELGVSSYREEKVSIKINYMTPKERPQTEFVVLSRFGFTQNILTNRLDVLLGQKIRAIIQRKDLQPRDFYDVVWLLSRNIHPDISILRPLGITTEAEAFGKTLEIFQDKVKPNLTQFKKRLQPFLVDESKISYLDMFESVARGSVYS